MPAADKGHVGHSKPADSPIGLPGSMPRPIKITMLGAGSGFTPTLMRDVLCIPTAGAGEIALVDIDESRLRTMHQIIARLVVESGKTGWRVSATHDRRQALPGSDYIVNCIEVSGLGCVRHDNDIPLRFGIDQCIGDTVGPGGLFKGLRTIPVFLDILRDALALCPNALFLNYTNPMSMLCLAAARAVPQINLVGLCHSVQGTSHVLAKRAGVRCEEMDWECAGINHLAWFTRLQHQGRDLYPALFEKARQDLAGQPADPDDAKDLVRKDMMLHFGAFITESSGHLSEYLPYYRKRKDLLAKYSRDKYDGGSSFYANEWPTWRKDADEKREKMVQGIEPLPPWERSWEYCSWIIEAREKDKPFRIHGNVPNTDPVSAAGPLISNLQQDGCVEVACMIDRNGINPTRYGKLPAQMAGICESNMRYFDLAATAAVERSKEAAIHALMLDPLTSAVCCPAEIKQMTLELFEAEKEFLPGYK
ncbi:MAG: alpha-glucosidase/alpha-galactosidase [Planctomycetota bacterium]|nr:alpha-glucosidase/alpha-galactosidase [Planctomycetota bacterium]